MSGSRSWCDGGERRTGIETVVAIGAHDASVRGPGAAWGGAPGRPARVHGQGERTTSRVLSEGLVFIQWPAAPTWAAEV